ncbi:MAG TPA: GAF domain-containing protein, partial [Nitrospirae bacterium]|nr:GAF domain-containing protein [Nitrospirota bacterium]
MGGTIGQNRAEMLLETFGSLGIASLVIDRNGNIVEANKAAADAFGYSGQEVVGTGITTLILDMDVTNFTRPANFICECIRSSGAIFSSNVSIVPLEHEGPLGGKGVSIVAVRDFSGPSLITKKASFVDKEISIFNYLSKSLAKPLNMKRIFRETVGRLPSLMGCDAAWVHLVDDVGSLGLMAHEGCTQACIEDIKRLDPGGACLIGKVFGTGRPLVVKDASSDPRVTHIRLADSGLRSMASVPMQSSGKVLGVLSLASREKSFFDPFEMKILSAVGNQLGVAIENARLITQLRKRMEQIELINEVSSAINSSLSIGTLFRIMVTEIRKLVGFDRGFALSLIHISEPT